MPTELTGPALTAILEFHKIRELIDLLVTTHF
jgi:hypothetical protein